MSKKTNSVVFMLVATLVNLLLMVAFFIVGFVIVGLLVAYIPSLADATGVMAILVFALAIFGSFFIYNKLVKWAMVRFNLEDKLDPLFSSKRNKRSKFD